MKNRVFSKKELMILKKNRFKKLDLMVRAVQVLEFNKITTLGKLLQYSRKEVLGMKGFWRARMNETTVNDLENELAKINLSLRK